MWNKSFQLWCALVLPLKTNFKCLDSVTGYKATSCGDDDDNNNDDNNNNDNWAIACSWILCWQLESHKACPMEREAGNHSNVGCPSQSPLLIEGQKDAKEVACGQRSGTKSRTSRKCCELGQSLDHSSKTCCLTECSLTSLRFPLPSDLLEQSWVAQAACLPTAMNSCSLHSSASPFWGTAVSSGSMVATEQLSSI